MVYKRCHEKGCTKAPRCTHQWYIFAQLNQRVARGPSAKFGFLLDPPHAEPQPGVFLLKTLPKNKPEAEELERRVYAWLSRGAPEPTPPPPPPSTPGPATDPTIKTVATVIEEYQKGHASQLKDKGTPSILKRIKDEHGHDPYTALFDRKTLRTFLDDIEDETSVVNRNRHLSRWRHLVYWLTAEDQLTLPVPFLDKRRNPHGVAKKTEGEGRNRRLQDDEEARLVAACAALEDGGQMLGRFYCALDAGLRRGEMLQLRRTSVLRNHQGQGLTLHVRWSTAKTARDRYVPVTSDRLRSWLNDRPFLEFPFGQSDGTRVDTFRTDWKHVLLQAGIDRGHYHQRAWVWDTDGDLHWHDLRHECGSRLADKGTPLHEIQKLLGHTTLETTQKYLNASFASLAANMRRAHLKLGV